MAGKGKPLKGVGTAGPYSGDIKKGGKLYKSTRDSFDITNARVGELENK